MTEQNKFTEQEAIKKFLFLFIKKTMKLCGYDRIESSILLFIQSNFKNSKFNQLHGTEQCSIIDRLTRTELCLKQSDVTLFKEDIIQYLTERIKDYEELLSIITDFKYLDRILTDDEQKVLNCLLSKKEKTTDLYEISQVLGFDKTYTKFVLSRLIELHLIKYDAEEGEYFAIRKK
jgi:hypothetical protein